METDLLLQAVKSFQGDHLPLLEACDDLIASMRSVRDQMPAEQASMIGDILAGINVQRSEFVQIVAPEMASMKASLVQSVEEFATAIDECNAEHAKATHTLTELVQNLPAEVDAAVEAAKAAVPVVEEPVIPALHPGEDLIAQLMSMRLPGQKAPSGVRSAGNIWENWKPGAGGT
jgi:hypothetical protein